MSEYKRLSELTGIADAEADDASFWPMNSALFLLGTAVMAMAFYFLDPADERWAFNPWTYAIATPVALLLLSLVLNSVVSRVVEKSMQIAILLSVFVHLLLLVYATNIVIFSRMWPDLMDSIAQQRQQLQRQQLQANQYHRITTKTQVGAQPDYLRFVPTEHQPTELELEESLTLARSERPNLVSPSPEIELTANPHLLKRAQASPSRPSAAEQPTTLSRSDLSRTLEPSATPEQYSLPDAPVVAAELSPSEDLSGARRNRPAGRVELSLPADETSPALASSALANRRPVMNRSQDSAGALQSLGANPAAKLGRDALRSSAVEARVAELAASPSVESSEVSQREALPTQGATLARNRSTPSRSSTLPNQLSPSTLEIPKSAIRRARVERREVDWTTPAPSAGAEANAIARDTAGGRTGPAASSSLPVFGPEVEVAAEQAGAALRPAPSIAAVRRRDTGRKSSLAADLGNLQAPRWDGQSRQSDGASGKSPLELSRQQDAGAAASADVAGLTGSARDLQRAAIGGPAEVGKTSQRVLEADAQSLRDSLAAGGGQRDLDPDDRNADAASSDTRLQRRRSSGASGIASSVLNSSLEQNAGLEKFSSPATQRATDGESLADSVMAARARATTERDSGGRGSAGQSLARADAGVSSPASSQVPELESGNPLEGGGGATRRVAPSDVEVGRRRSATAATRLEIEAPSGAGGVVPELNLAARSILPRRESMIQERTPIDLDSQRLARQDVGGALAAGQKVAMPTPAFQQRLERVRDREAMDNTLAEPQTELAIERGLAFLAKNQRADGSWRLQDYDTDVLMRSDTAATGLALLAFQGAGYTHKQFKYAQVVDKAIQFLRQNQTASGDLYIPQDPASDQNAWLYSHGIAALALCEAYGMTQDAELKPAAQASLNFMTTSQDPARGGWRYKPGVGSDTSVTGWFMMAMRSGQLAGLDVPEETLVRLAKYLEASQFSSEQPHLYRYNPFASDTPQQRHGLQPTAVMTSVGLLMRLYAGWRRDRAEMRDGTDYLLRNPPTHGRPDNSQRDTYYWYYATQVMFHMGGERWDRWHDQLYPLLIDNQVVSGENEGSWDPMLPAPDLWARFGGRLYVTTMNLLSLEVSYRHLPLYDATAE